MTRFISHCDEVDEGPGAGRGGHQSKDWSGRESKDWSGPCWGEGLLCRQWSGYGGESGQAGQGARWEQKDDAVTSVLSNC